MARQEPDPMTIESFLNLVASELGITIPRRPPSNLADSLPPALREFYGKSDGLALPFLELWTADQIETKQLPGFLLFGSDGLLSYCLCATDEVDDPVGLWDHEGGQPPETYLSSLADLLQDAYDNFFRDDDGLECTIHVKGAQDGVSLKSELARAGLPVEDAPLQIRAKNPARAITAVRQLRSGGVDCHLDPTF